METNFTISVGNRICFDVTIVDDEVIEYMKDYKFYLCLQNGTYHHHFSGDTYIFVRDNEGWFLIVMTCSDTNDPLADAYSSTLNWCTCRCLL